MFFLSSKPISLCLACVLLTNGLGPVSKAMYRPSTLPSHEQKLDYSPIAQGRVRRNERKEKRKSEGLFSFSEEQRGLSTASWILGIVLFSYILTWLGHYDFSAKKLTA